MFVSTRREEVGVYFHRNVWRDALSIQTSSLRGIPSEDRQPQPITVSDRNVRSSEHVAGATITIYDPARDSDNRYAAPIVATLGAAFTWSGDDDPTDNT